MKEDFFPPSPVKPQLCLSFRCFAKNLLFVLDDGLNRCFPLSVGEAFVGN